MCELTAVCPQPLLLNGSESNRATARPAPPSAPALSAFHLISCPETWHQPSYDLRPDRFALIVQKVQSLRVLMRTVSKVPTAIDELMIPDFREISKEAVSFVQRSAGVIGPGLPWGCSV